MLDARFPTYSPGSRTFADFARDNELHQLAAEIERTGTAFTKASAARVQKGQLTPEQANSGRQVWFVIGVELGCLVSHVRQVAAGGSPRSVDEERAGMCRDLQFPWADKVSAMRGEIEARRAGGPAAIAKGILTRDEAKQQLERLEAVHDLYWRQGFAFDGTRDELRALTNPILDYDIEQQQMRAA